ncbi:MAG: hypothetical protein QG651_300 [Pseudomonadota bacterium]|jgi:hypothetical protein|nr:hypothetical protein [Pseudomonadota bacterium]HCY38368.1 hypothetical protein [Neisseriales bacterium]
MKKISPNQLIVNTSRALRYLVFILTSILIAQIIWWFAKPIGYNSIENPALNTAKSQDFAQAIINRAAFGIYVEEHAAVPTINLKVIGVYAAGPDNSVAFLQVDDKHIIASIGDTVLEGKIKAITPTGIILTSQNQDVSIQIGGSNAMSNTPPSVSSAASTAQVNSFNNSNNSNVNNSHPNDSQPTTPPPIPPANNGTDGQPANANAPNNPDETLAAKRQKMIQEFQQQNSTNNQN